MITFPKATKAQADGGWIHNINFLHRIREELETTGICVIETDDLDDLLVAVEKAYNRFESYQRGE